jgi:uncharacterized phiE125 gp8 family phage protein
LQIVTRQPLEAEDAVIFDLYMDHLRIDGSQAHAAMHYADAASRELEQYCQIALLHQEIVAVSDPWPGQTLHLPIGPAEDASEVEVALIEANGDLTPITEGWLFHGGRYPSVTFATTPAGRLRVRYVAGFGPNAMTLPRDLLFAVMDQALVLYDERGNVDAPAKLCPSAARIAARYRRVMVA